MSKTLSTKDAKDALQRIARKLPSDTVSRIFPEYMVVADFINQVEEIITSQKAKTPALLREIENVYE